MGWCKGARGRGLLPGLGLDLGSEPRAADFSSTYPGPTGSWQLQWGWGMADTGPSSCGPC